MSMRQNPSVQPRKLGDQPDPVDRWLFAFFGSELPGSFPRPVLPAAGKRRFGWRSVFRSRLALAASVAVLFAGTWFLAGQFQGVEVPSTVAPNGRDLGKRDKPADPKKDKENKAQDTSRAPR